MQKDKCEESMMQETNDIFLYLSVLYNLIRKKKNQAKQKFNQNLFSPFNEIVSLKIYSQTLIKKKVIIILIYVSGSVLSLFFFFLLNVILKN